LPDGPVRPAVSFAVLAELLAVASMLVFMVPLVAIALPGLVAAIVVMMIHLGHASLQRHRR